MAWSGVPWNDGYVMQLVYFYSYFPSVINLVRTPFSRSPDITDVVEMSISYSSIYSTFSYFPVKFEFEFEILTGVNQFLMIQAKHKTQITPL